MPLFRIYYDDGRTYSGNHLDAPGWGVQVIVMSDRSTGRFFQCGFDYYIWRDTRWFGVDAIGAIDYLIQIGFTHAGDKKPVADILRDAIYMGHVKAGRTISQDDFQSIVRRANIDPDFPNRTATSPHEKLPPAAKVVIDG